MLKLDDLDIMYGEVKDLSELQDNRFTVEVEMKVYPVPNCSIVYKAKEYYASVKKVESTKTNKNVSELYTVTVTAALNVEPNELECSVNVICQVKPSKFFLVLETEICTGWLFS
ncbi:Hypothetical predicted protein [Mytilus galloprovincialis]|nr:Hypothetical predicted protein [Mytilus galloprovincialis]